MNHLKILSTFCKSNFHKILACLLVFEFLSAYPDMFYYFDKSRLLTVSKDTFFDLILSAVSHGFQIDLTTSLTILWSISVISFVLLFAKRTQNLGAIFSWICLNIWISSHNISIDGSHSIMAVFLLIFCISRLFEDTALFFRWGKIFLCLIYFNTGYSKLMDNQWRSGELLWNLSSAILAKHSVLSTASLTPLFPFLYIAGWFVIFSQLLTATLLLRPKLQSFFCLSEIVIHVSILFAIKLYLFSFLMILLNLTFFSGKDSETLSENTVN